MNARHPPGIGTGEQGISRQIDEPGDFRAESIAPTTEQNPDKPNSGASDDGRQWGRRLFSFM